MMQLQFTHIVHSVLTIVYLQYTHSVPMVYLQCTFSISKEYLQSTHSGPAVYPRVPTCIEQTEDIDDRLQSRDPDMTLLVIGQLHQFWQYCTLCGLQSTVIKHTYTLLKAQETGLTGKYSLSKALNHIRRTGWKLAIQPIIFVGNDCF